MTVLVLHTAKGHKNAILPARRHHRYFARKINPRLDHAAGRPKSAPDVVPAGLGLIEPHLSFAIVAESSRFQHTGGPERGHGGGQRLAAIDHPEVGAGQAVLSQECFFAFAILGCFQRLATWEYRLALFQRRQKRGGNILEFHGHDVHVLHKAAQGLGIVISGIDFPSGQLAGRTRRVFISKDHDPVPFAPRLTRQHAAQLPAADNTKRRARWKKMG